MNRRSQRRSLGLFAVAALVTLPVYADKQCELQRYAEMPVTMVGTRPLIAGTINGSPARFLADSGAFFSMLSRESAAKHQLKVGVLPAEIRSAGKGGFAGAGLAKVRDFTLTGFADGHAIKNVDFIVGGNMSAGDADGIIGQNVIGSADTEYDLANRYIRVFHAKDCAGPMLAYWRGTTAVAEMDLEPTTLYAPHLVSYAKINGKKIRVLLDSGAWRSILTLKAAALAGIKPENGKVAAGDTTLGIGNKTAQNWLARFDSLDLGGETIENARLRIGDVDLSDNADMLLGADFFLSHRLYVANKQHKIYFTYNGGPVFDLRAGAADASAAD